jgi:hypothetical protein
MQKECRKNTSGRSKDDGRVYTESDPELQNGGSSSKDLLRLVWNRHFLYVLTGEITKISLTRFKQEVAMNSRQFAKKYMGNLFTCLLALFLVAAPGGAQKDKSKPAPKPAATNSQSAPAKAAPAPARPAQPQPSPAQPQRSHPGTSNGITGQPSPGAPHGITGQPNPGTPHGITGQPSPGTPHGITGPIRPSPETQRPKPSGPVYNPRPGVQTTNHPDGTRTHIDSQTHTTVRTDASGRVTGIERPGIAATNIRQDGRAGHIVHSRADGSTMVVDRGLHGERSVEVVRRDGVRVVSVGRQGFVERPIRAGYVSRTYVAGGRTEVRVYRSYTYGSMHYYSYVPRVYYQPAFYGWAYRPWGAPVVYAWGWGPAPWFYGGYFAPEPVYPTASLWLTDYLLAENLKLSYQNRMAANGEGSQQQPALGQSSSVALTPEVKQMIAEEVQQQLAAEQADAAQPASLLPPGGAQSVVPDAQPPALDPKLRLFVVSAGLNVTATSDGQTCALTPGDIIQRKGRDLTTDGKVPVSVLNSKEGDCEVDFATAIDVSVLQDMHNQFREQIAAGMEKLASNQGKGGLPGGPAANPRQVAEGQATASVDAKDLVEKQVQEADRTEADVIQASNGGR